MSYNSASNKKSKNEIFYLRYLKVKNILLVLQFQNKILFANMFEKIT